MKDDSTAAEAKRLFVIPFIFKGLQNILQALL